MATELLRLGIGLVCMLLAAIGSMPLWQKAAMGFGDYRSSVTAREKSWGGLGWPSTS